MDQGLVEIGLLKVLIFKGWRLFLLKVLKEFTEVIW